MPIIQQFVNHDQFFEESFIHGSTIVINDLSDYLLTDKETLENNLKTVYSEDNISLVPTCSCGKLKSTHRLGQTCRFCNTKVSTDIFDDKKPLLWFKAPMLTWLNPHFYKMLSQSISGTIDVLRWIGDTSYNPPMKNNSILDIIRTIPNFQRSYTFFINNVENIIITILNSSFGKQPSKQRQFRAMLELYRSNKDVLHATYMPLASKSLFIVEKSSKGNYVTNSLGPALDLVLSFLSNINSERKVTMERTMAKTLSLTASLNQDIIKLLLSGKLGAARKHLYGTRANFTARNVIIPMTGPHKYDDVYLPYSSSVVVFRPHLMNKLIKRGYNYKTANKILFASVQQFNPLVGELLDELLAEAPDNKIPIISIRNPSLMQGSVLRLNVVKFKHNADDTTMNVSIMVVVLLRGDYDGDEVNTQFLLDQKLANLMETFRPRHSVPDQNRPFHVSGMLDLPVPAALTISNAIKNDRQRFNLPN